MSPLICAERHPNDKPRGKEDAQNVVARRDTAVELEVERPGVGVEGLDQLCELDRALVLVVFHRGRLVLTGWRCGGKRKGGVDDPHDGVGLHLRCNGATVVAAIARVGRQDLDLAVLLQVVSGFDPGALRLRLNGSWNSANEK